MYKKIDVKDLINSKAGDYKVESYMESKTDYTKGGKRLRHYYTVSRCYKTVGKTLKVMQRGNIQRLIKTQGRDKVQPNVESRDS